MCKLMLELFVVLAFVDIMAVLTLAEPLIEANESNKCTCKTSYLWKVEAEPPVYLYGTLHVPYTKMWSRIPLNQKVAFSSSGSLMVELEMRNPETLQKLIKCQFLPDGKTLVEVLPIDLYKRVTDYLKKMKDFFLVWLKKNMQGGGMNAFSLSLIRDKAFRDVTYNWEKRKPIWLMYFLDSINEDLLKYYKTPILDKFLDNAAVGLDIHTEAVENVVEHCRPFNSLNQDQVIVALRKQLDYLEPLTELDNGPPSHQDDYVKTFFCGNFESLVQTTEILPLPSVSNMSDITTTETNIINGLNEYLRKQIVYRRNRRMVKYLEKVFNNKTRNQTSFFAVGAGHFLGRKGVVDLLERRNYTVTRIPLEQTIDGPGLPDDIIALGDPSSVHTIIKIPKEIVTSAPPVATLKPPSPEELAEIFKDVFNTSSTFQGGSSSGGNSNPSLTTPSTSAPTTATSSPPSTHITKRSSHIRTRSGVILAFPAVEDDSVKLPASEPNSASSVIRWNLLVLLVISVVASVILL